MKTASFIKVSVLALIFVPFMSFGQLSSEPQDQFSTPETQESTTTAKVTEIKKMTRYAIGFVVELPTMNDVIEYMGMTLGVDLHEVDQSNDPNWNPTSFSTRNFKVSKNDQGEYAVVVRYYPPANPMEVENVSTIQRTSRLQCSEAFQQLKADLIK